ncbi:MAG: hypothetical protein OEM77_04720 [Nitrosopumilus sp.]|nr:hypothetical protein [Nitrosopumilus sp.]MDH3736446.1 hypothetical protein [Nitrosopumilus sp.]MDH3823894.1 hypothetical protein [Nitrosopumilus sp.]MDH3832996.1 hypothetical protein [Nitrosopumilus sp.]
MEQTKKKLSIPKKEQKDISSIIKRIEKLRSKITSKKVKEFFSI